MHIKCNVFQFLYQCISLDMALCFFVLHSTLRVSLAKWILGKMERKKNERTFWNMFNWEEKKKNVVGHRCFLHEPTKLFSPKWEEN